MSEPRETPEPTKEVKLLRDAADYIESVAADMAFNVPEPEASEAEACRRAALRLEIEARVCRIPPHGWWCSRVAGHEGPCAARPTSEPAGGQPPSDGMPNGYVDMTDPMVEAAIRHRVRVGWYSPDDARDVQWLLNKLAAERGVSAPPSQEAGKP